MKKLKLAALASAAVLSLSACSTVGQLLPKPDKTSDSSSMAPSSGNSAIVAPSDPVSTPAPIPAPKDGRTMPWPSQVWPDDGSPDRQLDVTSNAQPPGFTTPPAGSGRQRYLNQRLDWQPCGQQQCAKMVVPLDWEQPDGQAITIALKRKQALGADKLGTLFVNPGGPGGSAQDYAASFNVDGLEGYDIVGMDSRGSGQSTPVVCGTTKQLDDFFSLDGSPDDQGERDALVSASKQFARQCREKSGPLLDHITTIETVYDYDLARQLVGDEKLNFYGVSYGTYLGAVYAQLYPGNVGRMVLDSAVQLGPTDEVVQAEGFDLSLHNYAKWCVANSCGLGNSEDGVVKTFTDFFAGLDAKPLTTLGGRQLTQSLAVNGVALFFYGGAEVYSTLTQIMQSTLQSKDGSLLLRASDTLNDRTAAGYGTLATAFPAIRCADTPDGGIQKAFDTWVNRDQKRAPIFGQLFGPDVICAVWTAKPGPKIHFDAAGAAPILVLGNTGDSATPYQQAVSMSKILQSAVLLTRDGPGHGVYGNTACIDEPVRAYLNDGVVPKPGLSCGA